MYALDLSNWFVPRPITKEWVTRCRDEKDIRLFIVQGVNPPRGYPPSQTREQCEAVLSVSDVKLAGYVYPFFDLPPDEIGNRLATLDDYKSEMVDVFLDLEDVSSNKLWEQKVQITDAWLGYCDNWMGWDAGIYTGIGVWREMGFPTSFTKWRNRKLWWAGYPKFFPTECNCYIPLDAWDTPIIWQFSSSIQLFGASGFDYNIVHPDYEREIFQMANPVPQEYQDKFGCAADDWQCVVDNLEGIINQKTEEYNDLHAQFDSLQSNNQATLAISEIKEVIARHGY